MQDRVTIKRLIIVPLKGWNNSNIRENLNESKYCSGRNYEQIEVRECLLSFGAECLVFQFAILN
jgi:ubiquinone biosynthesis protein COQ9